MPQWPYNVEVTELPEVPQSRFIEPIEVTAGDQVLWFRSLSLYPANATPAPWVIKYSFRGVPGSVIDLTSTPTANGTDHQILVLPDTSALWPAGQYTVQGYAINPSSGPGATPERHVIYNGLIRVLPNLQLAAPELETRTIAKQILDNIDAVMLGRATDDILDSSIEGTQIKRIPIPDLITLRSYYLAAVKAEEAKAKIKGGRATGRRILTRFV